MVNEITTVVLMYFGTEVLELRIIKKKKKTDDSKNNTQNNQNIVHSGKHDNDDFLELKYFSRDFTITSNLVKPAIFIHAK